MKVPKQNCVGGPHSLSDEQLSEWKHQLVEHADTSLFASTDKHYSEATETTELVLTFLIFGLNKRWHFRVGSA